MIKPNKTLSEFVESGPLDAQLFPVDDYGLRPDGSRKGAGWLGSLPTSDGDIATELTFDIDMDGKRIYLPLIVPGHSEEDMDAMLSGGQPSAEAYDRAVRHGLDRIRRGLSPYK